MVKQSLQFIDEFNVKEKTKGSWIEICYANIIVMLCCMIAFFFAPVSIALLVLAFIYLEVGLHSFVLKHIRKEKVGYEDIFVAPKLFIKAFVLKLIYLSTIILWGLLLIVPGVICALNYAFVVLIYLDNPNNSVGEILSKSKNLIAGFRIKVMLIFLTSLIICCAGIAIGFGISMLLNLIFAFPNWAMALLMIFFGGIALIFVSLPLYQTFLTSCYLESLSKGNSDIKEKKSIKATKTVGKKK